MDYNDKSFLSFKNFSILMSYKEVAYVSRLMYKSYMTANTRKTDNANR